MEDDFLKYQIWYMRSEFFSEGILGKKLPDALDLSATHVHLKDIETTSLAKVYLAMKAENWSPNGEARELIESKGLQHTSMSIGDVIVDDVGNAHTVSSFGFRLLGAVK